MHENSRKLLSKEIVEQIIGLGKVFVLDEFGQPTNNKIDDKSLTDDQIIEHKNTVTSLLGQVHGVGDKELIIKLVNETNDSIFTDCVDLFLEKHAPEQVKALMANKENSLTLMGEIRLENSLPFSVDDTKTSERSL